MDFSCSLCGEMSKQAEFGRWNSVADFFLLNFVSCL